MGSRARWLGAAFILATTAAGPRAAPVDVTKGLHPSTRKDVLRAIDLGLRWLKEQQQPDGHWSLAQFPAITALAARAYLEAPGRDRTRLEPHVKKALDFIVSCARADGGLYRDVARAKGGGLRNYNTAICMAALTASGDSRYAPVVEKAREFLIGNQFLGAGVYYGGWGYDKALGRPYCDMANTVWTAEALYETFFVVDIRNRPCRPEERTLKPFRERKDARDANWQAAVRFLERCQNIPSKAMPDKRASLSDADRGGFFYEPRRGMAGRADEGAGDAATPIWRSHGTASYSGLLCYLYAHLKRDDPRVQAAVDWVRRNYTLKEHPGLGRQGLYYYYFRMAKALSVFGEEPLALADRRRVNWREEIAAKVISLQRIDPKTGLGYWVNENGRWMENDPVLVTAYSLLALETLFDEAPR